MLTPFLVSTGMLAAVTCAPASGTIDMLYSEGFRPLLLSQAVLVPLGKSADRSVLVTVFLREKDKAVVFTFRHPDDRTRMCHLGTGVLLDPSQAR